MPRHALRHLAAAALMTAASCAPALAAVAQPQIGYVTAVLIGLPDPANIVPTFDKVSGAQVDNLDVALPAALLTRGQPYVVMVMSQISTFSGNCQSSYVITQTSGSTTTTINKGKSATYACSAKQIFGLAIGTRPIGGVAGPASLIGEVKFGTQIVRLKVPVILQ